MRGDNQRPTRPNRPRKRVPTYLLPALILVALTSGLMLRASGAKSPRDALSALDCISGQKASYELEVDPMAVQAASARDALNSVSGFLNRIQASRNLPLVTGHNFVKVTAASDHVRFLGTALKSRFVVDATEVAPGRWAVTEITNCEES